MKGRRLQTAGTAPTLWGQKSRRVWAKRHKQIWHQLCNLFSVSNNWTVLTHNNPISKVISKVIKKVSRQALSEYLLHIALKHSERNRYRNTVHLILWFHEVCWFHYKASTYLLNILNTLAIICTFLTVYIRKKENWKHIMWDTIIYISTSSDNPFDK